MKSKKRKLKWDWFRVGGGFLALWALMNTSISISRYGFSEGFYWWFCNLALTGIAYGLLTKHRGWILGFLSIAAFTQSFWIIDNLWRSFTGKNLFGLVEFMYQPGLPLDEFLLSHYHYITMPIALLALFHLPKPKNGTQAKASTLIAIFNPLIFAVSYFFFPAHQNINCIHEPCFPGLENLAGPVYSFSFWLVIFLAHLGMAALLENYFSKKRITLALKAKAQKAFYGVCGFVIVVSLWDTHYAMSLPKFACQSSSPTQDVSLRCGFTLDYLPKVMLFEFEAENKAKAPQFCQLKMKTEFADGKLAELTLNEGRLLAPGETQRFYAPIEYPHQTVRGTLFSTCNDPDRMVTSTVPSPR